MESCQTTKDGVPVIETAFPLMSTLSIEVDLGYWVKLREKMEN